MDSIRIVFVRHGRTVYNDLGAFSGRTDVPLTEEGVKLLRELKADSVYPDVERVYTSPAKRTKMTADIIFPDVPRKELYNLWEFDFGEKENTPVSEYEGSTLLKKWTEVAPEVDFCRDSETYLEAALRGKMAVTHIIRDCIYEGLSTVAVVSHAAFMRALFKHTLIPAAAAAEHRLLHNGHGLMIETDPELWFEAMKLRFICSVPVQK
ncbi:MAG: phosphoglycerate mutase family protein [Lachnospiraceae bacterium]|nr:phosphoglycerate mutase family protein [Lachnospiraceae bacterium]